MHTEYVRMYTVSEFSGLTCIVCSCCTDLVCDLSVINNQLIFMHFRVTAGLLFTKCERYIKNLIIEHMKAHLGFVTVLQNKLINLKFFKISFS